MQSVLSPGGEEAQELSNLTWLLIVGGFAILIAVLVIAALAMFASADGRALLGSEAFVISAGIMFPVVTLSALLLYEFLPGTASHHPDHKAELQIEITGEQFWWRVFYRKGGATDDEQQAFSTANELHIPVGQPTELLLKTNDVIHSFWVPSLAGKVDMIPGHVNRLTLKALRAGVYRGQCAEYCGDQHAQMAFYVVAHEEEEFVRWRAEQQQPAVKPPTPFIENGQKLFTAAGCGACHTIRGTEATGTIGPDLTHVGGRKSIGAGLLPNNAGTLAGWIASAQHLKPGNKMPSFNLFKGAELRAIAAYLESLK